MESNANADFFYRSLYEHNPEMVYLIDTFGTVKQRNSVFSKTLGYSNNTELKATELLFHSEDIQSYKDAFYKALSGVPQNMETAFINQDGRLIDINLTLIPTSYDGHISAIFGIAKDITDHKKAEDLNKHLAFYDSLTNLPNRRLFQEKLEQDLIISKTLQQKLAVMYLDLDRFKYINDTLGHFLGDKLLVQIAKRLRKCLGEDVILARLGGDEFGVLLPNFYMHQVIERSKTIIDALEGPFLIEGYHLFITTSIGISIYPNDGEDSHTLMKNADSALYKAKELGKNNFQVYTSSMNAQTFKIFSLESNLRNAIDLNQLELYYQPKVCPNTYDIIGAEALIRWNHPEWGLVLPDEFISLAEETGLDIELGSWVKRTACIQNKLWQDANLPKIPVSINLSANRFLEHSLLINTVETLKETKLEPKYLEVEITETSLLENEKIVFSVLGGLKELGIKVALDDFGTGYSSLSSLKRFKGLIDILKIDRTFIKDLSEIETDDSNFITNMIIQLSQQLKMEVVAEGVETSEQLQVLRNYNCNTIQGYLFSKPVSTADFEKLLRKGKIMPLESNTEDEDFIDHEKDFRIKLEHSLSASMTLTHIRGKKVELGTTEVLIYEIWTRGIRFISNIKLAANQEIILGLKTKILNQIITLEGSVVWLKEKNTGVYQYELEYKMEEVELVNLTSTLDQFDARLKESPLVPDCSFVLEDKYAFFHKS
ncbi:EAL domain-containing protein [Psychrobacillus vulpis]|uniref:EAL domain-containing protein n=1 Tax=Psychrobacillus vulpis TaxID=2325572 RepID=A0A544TSC6_9BACI|nr:EAL domain-containing protein [Psychrobacillus vulpis]TQR20348.1 EAL domain-containing protein [Psychrobacillus vulpis]